MGAATAAVTVQGGYLHTAFPASIVFAFAGLALLHGALSLRVALPLLLTALFVFFSTSDHVRQGMVFAPVCLGSGMSGYGG